MNRIHLNALGSDNAAAPEDEAHITMACEQPRGAMAANLRGSGSRAKRSLAYQREAGRLAACSRAPETVASRL
jgi:hypothetical protein